MAFGNSTLESVEFVLIETLWNVKENGLDCRFCYELVLIETLWNVKEVDAVGIPVGLIVLIETLWNVKVHSYLPSKNAT